MDEPAFFDLIRRQPFGTCDAATWNALAARLLDSLSRFLGVPMEFVGGRRPDCDSFVPLVRSVGQIWPAFDVRVAGMIYCAASGRNAGLEIDTLLLLFAGGTCVGPPGRQFVICKYLGPGDGAEWSWSGWRTSDIPEEWNPYTFERYFCGREAELPGCGSDA